MKNVRTRDFFAWCLSFCFASLALTAAAQTQPSGSDPDTNASVAVPPDGQTQQQLQPPPMGLQPPPATDIWDRWGIQKVSDDDDWTRHFRVGAMVGLNITASFSQKSSLVLAGGDPNKGNFDDGYVHPSGNGPYTSDWGYNNSSQYNASQHTLSMHQATSFSSPSGSSSESGNSAFVGFDMAYGGNLIDWGHARIGWDLGFGLLPINISANVATSGQVNQKAFAFDTTGIDNVGIIPNPFPPAGYHGGPGGALDLPSALPLATTNSVDAKLAGSHSLNVMLYTLRLGPSVYWDLNQYLGVAASAGPAVGLVSGRMEYNEIITETGSGDVVHNHGKVDGTDFVYGGYVNASLMYHLEEHGDLYVGVQYMSLGDATISGGGRQGQLNLGCQIYLSAGINWPF